MSKGKYFPLYHGDWLADTTEFNATQQGAYLLLIIHCWREGALPADEDRIRRIARLTPKEWSSYRESLAEKFGPGWTHDRVAREKARAEDLYRQKVEASRLGVAARFQKPRPNGQPLGEQGESSSSSSSISERTNLVFSGQESKKLFIGEQGARLRVVGQ